MCSDYLVINQTALFRKSFGVLGFVSLNEGENISINILFLMWFSSERFTVQLSMTPEINLLTQIYILNNHNNLIFILQL